MGPNKRALLLEFKPSFDLFLFFSRAERWTRLFASCSVSFSLPPESVNSILLSSPDFAFSPSSFSSLIPKTLINFFYFLQIFSILLARSLARSHAHEFSPNLGFLQELRDQTRQWRIRPIRSTIIYSRSFSSAILVSGNQIFFPGLRAMSSVWNPNLQLVSNLPPGPCRFFTSYSHFFSLDPTIRYTLYMFLFNIHVFCIVRHAFVAVVLFFKFCDLLL